jgi:hypothetical protein
VTYYTHTRLGCSPAAPTVAKERLGHATIATTERCRHALPDADETAVDALSAIRNRGSSRR